MKKVILAIVLAGSVSVTYAQQPPIPDMPSDMQPFNSWLIYGDFGYNNQNNDNSAGGQKANTTNFSVNPGIGYRLNDNFTVGVQGGISYSKTSISNTGASYSFDNKTDNWNLGLFVRHTCISMSKMFYCYSQLNLSYVSMDAYPNNNYLMSVYNTSTNDQITNGYGYQAMWFPALGMNLPHNFSVNLNLGGISYTAITQDHGNGTNNNINVTFAKEIRIGVSKEFNFHTSNSRSYREPGDELQNRHIERMGGDDEDGGGNRRESRKVHDMDDE